MPIIEDLLAAKSRHCIPYLDPEMSSEETKKYIMAFFNDDRIDPQIHSNIFQTCLKMFNAGGGLLDLNHWKVPAHEHSSMPKVVMDDIDIVCLKSFGNCPCLCVTVSCSHRA